MDADGIAALLSGYRFHWNNERELQDHIEKVLTNSSIAFKREYRLCSRDRVDFLCGAVAIEVKMASSQAQVLAQLFRYAESCEVESLILVTNRARQLEMPDTLLNKPLRVVFVSGYL